MKRDRVRRDTLHQVRPGPPAVGQGFLSGGRKPILSSRYPSRGYARGPRGKAWGGRTDNMQMVDVWVDAAMTLGAKTEVRLQAMLGNGTRSRGRIEHSIRSNALL